MTAYLFGVNVRVLGEATKSKDSNSHCGGFYEFYMRLSGHLHRERQSFDGSAGQQHDLIVYPLLFFIAVNRYLLLPSRMSVGRGCMLSLLPVVTVGWPMRKIFVPKEEI